MKRILKREKESLMNSYTTRNQSSQGRQNSQERSTPTSAAENLFHVHQLSGPLNVIEENEKLPKVKSNPGLEKKIKMRL